MMDATVSTTGSTPQVPIPETDTVQPNAFACSARVSAAIPDVAGATLREIFPDAIHLQPDDSGGHL
jgi:hypothetical protein